MAGLTPIRRGNNFPDASAGGLPREPLPSSNAGCLWRRIYTRRPAESRFANRAPCNTNPRRAPSAMPLRAPTGGTTGWPSHGIAAARADGHLRSLPSVWGCLHERSQRRRRPLSRCCVRSAGSTGLLDEVLRSGGGGSCAHARDSIAKPNERACSERYLPALGASIAKSPGTGGMNIESLFSRRCHISSTERPPPSQIRPPTLVPAAGGHGPGGA